MIEMVDYFKESDKDLDNYVYAKCKCPVPENYCYKISKKSSKYGVYEFICPECKTKIRVGWRVIP